MPVKLKIDFSSFNVNELVRQRAKAFMVEPELVLEKELANKDYYKRFQDIIDKEKYRGLLLSKLFEKWSDQFGIEQASQIRHYFIELTKAIEHDGALVFADLIPKNEFIKFIAKYDSIMEISGSKSIIHTFVDFRNHSDLLTQNPFCYSSIHPLLIALISYGIGGAIRVVDARGKDAEPISILAQDNMLHIDNTPFNDEYKILITWERNKASGPKGQNFVYIPSTHKGSRNCFVRANGEVWSTENASIFITPKSIDKVFEFQKKIRNENKNIVVEVQDESSPLFTVFAAGSLVHHRYRTSQGHPRSCVIIAFHRSKDNPGEFVTGKTYSNIGELLICNQNEDNDSSFVNEIMKAADQIGNKVKEVFTALGTAKIIRQEERQLEESEILNWQKIITSAPTIEELKMQNVKFPTDSIYDKSDLIQFVSENMMRYDKHGPLDLILYSDNHEECRKWARNRIREMKLTDINLRLQRYFQFIQQPQVEHLLLPSQLINICSCIIDIAKRLTSSDLRNVDEGENISSAFALKSITQLVEDLKESIDRCYSIQNYLSTSLFMFWALDELNNISKIKQNEIFKLSEQLLHNYIATGILTDYFLKQNC